MMFKHKSSASRRRVLAMLRADAQMLRWLSGTILGRAVVPDVCSISAMSSELGCSASAAASPPAPDSGPNRNAPAGCPASGASSKTRTPSRPGCGDCGRVVAFFYDEGLGIEIVKIELEFFPAECGVQRSGGGVAGNGDEGCGHFRPVVQHDCHPVRTPDAEPGQSGGGMVDQGEQRAKRERLKRWRAYRRCRRRVLRQAGNESWPRRSRGAPPVLAVPVRHRFNRKASSRPVRIRSGTTSSKSRSRLNRCEKPPVPMITGASSGKTSSVMRRDSSFTMPTWLQ